MLFDAPFPRGLEWLSCACLFCLVPEQPPSQTDQWRDCRDGRSHLCVSNWPGQDPAAEPAQRAATLQEHVREEKSLMFFHSARNWHLPMLGTSYNKLDFQLHSFFGNNWQIIICHSRPSHHGSSILFFFFRMDCLIKTVKSEGYFGMYRGKTGYNVHVNSGLTYKVFDSCISAM